MKEFNNRELKLINDIEDAERYISGDNDLEMNLHDGGWYAHEYNGNESILLKNFDKPLITEDEIDEEDIDVYQVFNHCNVFYCG